MTLDLQPTLVGRLVILRPLHPDDFEALYAVARDPFIWEQHPVKDRHKERKFRSFFEEALSCGGTLAVIEAATRKVIGSTRFHVHDDTRREIEIGWTFVAREFWGGQYNREMKHLMMEHAFRYVDTVVFFVGVDNIRSQKAVEKIGGVRIGTGSDAGGRKSFVYRIGAADFSP